MTDNEERGGRDVLVTGMSVASGYGRGLDPLLAGVLAGTPAFAPVGRFDVSGRRVTVAAAMAGTPSLSEDLVFAVSVATGEAGLAAESLPDTPLLLAVHADPDQARIAPGRRWEWSAAALARGVARRSGLGDPLRVYTSACVAASTAVADAAALISLGRYDRLVVAAGYLVDADQFALFDAGRALATDGRVRPFSAGRTGLLLGDGVAAVVLESAAAARARGAEPLARLAGWGRAGDAYHVCQPRPDGTGMARAIGAALDRAGVPASEVGYVNAHGSGTAFSDVSETAALRLAGLGGTPLSSTKALHGQALEASGLLELVLTVAAVRAGQLPTNAGFLGPDEECALDLILDAPRPPKTPYALSLNAAFGGANTALLVEAL
ncbi:beta-ketoacyl synthase N-terminal-like domain-containing protein [Longispora sp. NPDC051575]|uniref:beta-ketoacyl synthase N-terminal-like domain-containing protein n=1 Tax=Longispora sp. NPDC051575 TaxID=3154943 RepID=UPI00343A9839